MKIFIIVVGLLELLVGSVLMINPRLMAAYKKGNNALITTARMYGAAAISIGIFAVYIYLNFENTILHEPFLIVFAAFHFLVSLAIIISSLLKQTRDLKIAILHGLFFIITLYFLIQ
ncbi:hypothetical protein OAO25_05105 [Flavobacteriaceae bacterium]|nr:hypothetical protein [Flavobacteriaceae bacterium]